jgi:hypothetical protein
MELTGNAAAKQERAKELAANAEAAYKGYYSASGSRNRRQISSTIGALTHSTVTVVHQYQLQ